MRNQRRRQLRISQTNNSYIFPGLALGILVSASAAGMTDGMIMAAAKTTSASLSPTAGRQQRSTSAAGWRLLAKNWAGGGRSRGKAGGG